MNTEWEYFLTHIRDAYRLGYTPPAEDLLNRAKDHESSHIEWEDAVSLLTYMVLTGDRNARKAARLVRFVQDHPQIGWWYG